MTRSFLGRCNTGLLTPDRNSKTDQYTDTTEVLLVSYPVLLDLLREIWVRGYFSKQKFLKDDCIMCSTHMAYRQLNRLESVLSKWLNYLKSFAGSWTGFRVFFAAWVFWEDSLQSLLFSDGREWPSGSAQFQELLEAIVSCFTFYLKELPCGVESFSLWGNC